MSATSLTSSRPDDTATATSTSRTAQVITGWTTTRLRVGDSVRQARQLYGNALRLSFEQGGTWFARTPTGQLDGFTYGRSGNRTDIGLDSRIGTIEAGKVGCAALSP